MSKGSVKCRVKPGKIALKSRQETALKNIKKHLTVAHKNADAEDALIKKHRSEIEILEERIE